MCDPPATIFDHLPRHRPGRAAGFAHRVIEKADNGNEYGVLMLAMGG
jgi:hypothetical protein